MPAGANADRGDGRDRRVWGMRGGRAELCHGAQPGPWLPAGYKRQGAPAAAQQKTIVKVAIGATVR